MASTPHSACGILRNTVHGTTISGTIRRVCLIGPAWTGCLSWRNTTRLTELNYFSTTSASRIPMRTRSGQNGSEPVQFGLLPNYPNPFIRPPLSRSCSTGPGRVDCDCSTCLERRFSGRRLPIRIRAATRVTWDARDASGRPLPSGLYICRLETGRRAPSSTFDAWF